MTKETKAKKYLAVQKHSSCEVAVMEDKFNVRAEVRISPAEFLELEGELARNLIARWGMVAGEWDGEDSSGRSKCRRLTPEELVEEACTVAELTCKKFREKGWLIKIPTASEAEAIVEAAYS